MSFFKQEPPMRMNGGPIAPRPPMSEQAATAAQYVHDLESERAQLHGERDDHIRRIRLLEEQLSAKADELAAQQERAAFYQSRLTSIVTKLNLSAQVILDAMREDPNTPHNVPVPPSEVLHEQVEEAVRQLNGGGDSPLPA